MILELLNPFHCKKNKTKLNIDADDDQKKDEFLKIQQKSVSKINFNIYL